MDNGQSWRCGTRGLTAAFVATVLTTWWTHKDCWRARDWPFPDRNSRKRPEIRNDSKRSKAVYSTVAPRREKRLVGKISKVGPSCGCVTNAIPDNPLEDLRDASQAIQEPDQTSAAFVRVGSPESIESGLISKAFGKKVRPENHFGPRCECHTTSLSIILRLGS